MDLEQIKKILEGAPEWATMYSVSDKCYYGDYAIYDDDILLSDLRAELGKRDTLDLEVSDIPHGTIVLEK